MLLATPKYSALIFDMDGLMLDTERIYHAAFRATGQELGFPFSEELLLATTGRTMADGYRMVQEALGPDFPLARFQALWPRYWHEIVERDGIPQKAGLAELLAWIDARAIPKAVATSTAWDTALLTLRAGGLAGRFNIIVTGDQIEHGKPAPDIYLLAAAKLGVDPQSCVALEDSFAGVLAASAAGMTTIMVPDIQQPAADVAARAALVADSLHEAKRWLDIRMTDKSLIAAKNAKTTEKRADDNL